MLQVGTVAIFFLLLLLLGLQSVSRGSIVSDAVVV